MSKNALILTFAAAIVVVMAVSCFYLYPMDDDEGNEGTVVEIDVTANGDEKTLMLVASDDKFDVNATSGSFLVYYFELTNYIVDGNFDYDSFYADMEKQGAYDEDLGEYLPSNAVRVRDFTFNVESSTEMTLTFSEPGTYAAYIVVLCDTAVTDGQAVAVSLYDVPETTYKDVTPRITLGNEVYQDDLDCCIVLNAENTEFVDSINAASVSFSGALSDLEIKSVERNPDCVTSLTIYTSGYVPRSTSSTGYVDILGDVTTSGEALSALVEIQDCNLAIDGSSFVLDGSVLSFDLLVSLSIYEDFDLLSLIGTEYDIDDIVKSVSSDHAVLGVSVPTTGATVDEGIDAIAGDLVKFYMDGSSDYLDYSLCIPGAVVSGYADSATVSDGKLTVTMPVYAYSGTISGLTSEMVKYSGDYGDVTVSVEPSDDGYNVILTVPDFSGDSFSGSITLADGVTTPWGTDAGDMTVPVSVALGGSPSVTADEMIGALYKNMNFNKIMGKINIATAGIGAVIDILGATGVIDMRSATDIAIAEINLKCDEIKNMLADQSLQLEKMSKKLDEIQGMLKEQRLLDLSKIYHDYLAANNRLANDITLFSSDIKKDVSGLTSNSSGDSFYVYVTEEGKLSIVKGGFFEQKYYGQTVDGKGFLSDYTIAISLDYGATFAKANTGSFNKDTESKMVDCLKAYIDDPDNNIAKEFTLKDGSKVSYTSDELAQQVYDCIVVNYTYERANGDDGKTLLKDYYAFTETMASLVVSPSGDVTISSDLRSNPLLASQEIMQANYNFESEAHDYLKSLNDSTTMFLYNYTLVASGVEQMLGSNGTTVEKHYDASMKFLSGHRGYLLDSDFMHDYCYVTNTYVSAKDVTIEVKATYHSTDNFHKNVSNSPTDITPIKTQQQLGIPSKYLNTDQLKKIQENYNRLKSQGVTHETFKQYLEDHTGRMFTKFMSSDLITSFDGGENYNDGRHVKLYSNQNIVSPGHGAQLVDSGSIYEISGTIDKSGFLKQFKAYSSNVYGKIAYKGDLFNLSTDKFYDQVCNVHGYIYAVGFFCKHVHAWTYDEGAVLTPEKSLQRCWVWVENGNVWRTFAVHAEYEVIALS